MRTPWHDAWGCARGPVARLAPATRIIAGAIVFIACMAAPAATRPGILLVASTAALWLLACRPPSWLVRSSIRLGLAMFLPYFLITPLVPADRPLAVPWSVLLHGLSSLLVSVSTASTMTATDLRDGLLGLPVPRLVSAILLQIVHQSATLLYETRRVADAIRVRCATSSPGVLFSLPRVWLPRIFLRAERVASAMEIRGYCEADPGPRGFPPIGPADAAALALAGIALCAAAALRWTS